MTISAVDNTKTVAGQDNTTMATDVRRDNFKHFWDKFSDKPDTNSMMLNHSAEELEAADRADILACLPHLANKDVVDIGAGIGRFTTVLAETARWVLSTDFIESFVAKNQERNAHMGNVNYQVGDAVHLKMDENSVDLVFTNWLMMYLSDAETIEFLFNCMRWLREDGYVHLRESCSEPSTGRTKTNTMHSASDANPTHYRFSSLYIKLLQNLRYKDNDGKVWKFDVQWSCSVPTYIKRQNNWRQVHWLVKKVAAEELTETTPAELLKLLERDWKEDQLKWDSKLDGEKYVWTDKILSRALSADIVTAESTSLVFTPREQSPYTHVNSHLLAEKFACNVWNVESHPYYYRTSLTKANTLKDQKVRFSWNKNLTYTIDYWAQRQGSFDSLISTELLSTSTETERKQLATVMNPKARVVLLEPLSVHSEETLLQRANECGLKNVIFEDVTDAAVEAQRQYCTDHSVTDTIPECKWVLIKASF